MLFGWDIGTIGGIIVMPSFISYDTKFSSAVDNRLTTVGHIISVRAPTPVMNRKR
jgi:hypothetical protein